MGWLPHQPQRLCQYQAFFNSINDNQFLRCLQAGNLYHAQPQRPCSRQYDHIIQLNILLPQYESHRPWVRSGPHLHDSGSLGFCEQWHFQKTHIFRHATFCDIFLEAIDIVRFTHPVAARFAIATVPARDYLFRNHTFADLILRFGPFSQRHNMAVEFMSRYYWWFYPWGFSPKHFAPFLHLQSPAQIPQPFTLITNSLAFGTGVGTCSKR